MERMRPANGIDQKRLSPAPSRWGDPASTIRVLKPLAVDISESLPVGVYDLEACVYGFNGPWCCEAPHLFRDGLRSPRTYA